MGQYYVYYSNGGITGGWSRHYLLHEKYNDFVMPYEEGKTIIEIVEVCDFSRRTAYRYKEYYYKLNKKYNACILDK